MVSVVDIILSQVIIAGFIYTLFVGCYRCIINSTRLVPESSQEEENMNCIRIIKVSKFETVQLKEDSSYDTCAICIEPYSPEENVSEIQPCGHMFHEGCIDDWMKKSVSCPLCNI